MLRNLHLIFFILVSCNFREEKRPAMRDLTPVTQRKISYSDVASKVFAPACYQCHGEGRALGGVMLDSYASAAAEADAIRDVVFVKQSMPPGDKLAESELRMLRAWLDANTPENAEGDGR